MAPQRALFGKEDTMIDRADTSQGSPKAAGTEEKSFSDVLRALMGKSITVVNPESYEDAPIGHKIKTGFYRAKVAGLGRDYVVIHTNFASISRTGQKVKEEPVKQYIPISRIKRVSLLEKEAVFHL